MPRGVYVHRKMSIEERFWAKVDKNGPIPAHVPELGPCWIWLGYIRTNGYGTLGHGSTGLVKAHHASWIIHYGPIPDDMNVLHRCDNRSCPNNTHLFLGTQLDNIQDMMAKGRHAHGSIHGDATLTESQVLEIRAKYAEDSISQRALARNYKVSETQIHRIISRKSWSHV